MFMPNYQAVLNEIHSEIKNLKSKGKVADYIPALKSISNKKFALALRLTSGEEFNVGHANEKFSIQSISKVFTLTMAMQELGDKIWKRVGKEPSGTSYNSLVQLEKENGIPRNPFINAGSLVITDCIASKSKNPQKDILDFVHKISNNSKINYDKKVAKSEQEWGDRNKALAYFLKSFKNINADVDTVLETYFSQCSLSMSCLDLVRAFSYLANSGLSINNERVINPRQVKRINSLMMTSGTYDTAGDFAYRVGLPGKSGVGGGIVAVMPGHYTIATWSPGLNESGNSLAGTKALELFTTKTKSSVF